MEENDDPIRSFQDRMHKSADASEGLRPTLNACRDAVQRSQVAGCGISVGTYGPMSPKVEIICSTNRLDDLVPLFRELAKEGLKTNKDKPYKDQNAFGVIGFRHYDLGPQCLVIAMVFADKVKSEAEDDRANRCHLVQTGYEQVPKYEIVCNEHAPVHQ